jgi:hypothetical protein
MVVSKPPLNISVRMEAGAPKLFLEIRYSKASRFKPMRWNTRPSLAHIVPYSSIAYQFNSDSGH